MDRLLKDRQILIVDDTAVQRVLLMEILRGSGAVLAEASSGEQAMEMAAGRRYDAILLDIRMAGQNGIEVCRALRATEAYRFTPIVFITAIEERELLQWALEAGADDFIKKPVHGVVLRRRLANLLQRAEALEAVGAVGAGRIVRVRADAGGASIVEGKLETEAEWRSRDVSLFRLAPAAERLLKVNEEPQILAVMSGRIGVELAGTRSSLMAGAVLLAEGLAGQDCLVRAEGELAALAAWL
jgi:CheY-like chemotaxis protein